MLHNTSPIEPPQVGNRSHTLSRGFDLGVDDAERAVEYNLIDGEVCLGEVVDAARSDSFDGVVAAAEDVRIVLNVVLADEGGKSRFDLFLLIELVDELVESCALEAGRCWSGGTVWSFLYSTAFAID